MTRADWMWRRVTEALVAVFLVAVLVWMGSATDVGPWLGEQARAADVRVSAWLAAGGALPAAWSGSSRVTVGAAAPAAQRQPGAGPPQARIVRTLKHPYYVFWVAWSPDGTQLATGGVLDLRVSIWDPHTGKLLRTLADQKGGVNALAYSADGRYLAAGRGFVASLKDKNSVSVWDAKTGALVRALPGLFPGPRGNRDGETLTFSPAGYSLVVAYETKTLVYDAETGQILRSLGSGGNSFGDKLALAPAGTRVAIGNVWGRIDIVDIGTGAVIRTIRAHSGHVTSLAYSPDGNAVASGTMTGTEVGNLNPATGQMERRKNEDPIRIWDSETGLLVRELAGHTGSVRAMAYTKDGRWLLSGSEDKSVRVWDVTAGTLRQTLLGHDDFIYSVCLSPDGRYLASGGGPRVTIWEFTPTKG